MGETASARGAHTNRAGREFLRCRTDDLVSEGVGGIELSVLVEELFEPAERGADARDGWMQRGAFPLNDNNMSVSTSVSGAAESIRLCGAHLCWAFMGAPVSDV